MAEGINTRPDECALRERIILKRRTRKELQDEIEALQSLVTLQRLESRLKVQQRQKFNPLLALQLDAVAFLVNSIGERSYPSPGKTSNE